MADSQHVQSLTRYLQKQLPELMWCYHHVPTQPRNLQPNHNPTIVRMKNFLTSVFSHILTAQAFSLCHAAAEHPAAELQLCPSAMLNSSLLKPFANARTN